MNNEKILLSQAEAAAYLGTTVGTLNSWRHYSRSGKYGQLKAPIPFVRWGNRIRYKKSDLDAWITAHSENLIEKGE